MLDMAWWSRSAQKTRSIFCICSCTSLQSFGDSRDRLGRKLTSRRAQFHISSEAGALFSLQWVLNDRWSSLVQNPTYRDKSWAPLQLADRSCSSTAVLRLYVPINLTEKTLYSYTNFFKRILELSRLAFRQTTLTLGESLSIFSDLLSTWNDPFNRTENCRHCSVHNGPNRYFSRKTFFFSFILDTRRMKSWKTVTECCISLGKTLDSGLVAKKEP